jgi:Fe-Mn family superoxide dismutase
MDRRTVFTMGGALLMASVLKGPGRAEAAAPLGLPKLPHAEDALQPTIFSAHTVALHYGKHHKQYFDKLNELVRDTPYAGMKLEEIVRKTSGREREAERKIFNNAAQAWNHVAYWDQMVPGGAKMPRGKLMEDIGREFGSFEAFKDKFADASEAVFGTGWVWLTRRDGKLAIVGYGDAGSPMAFDHAPLLGIDVWEHAYYLDYENRRREHVKSVLDKLINWDVVEGRPEPAGLNFS